MTEEPAPNATALTDAQASAQARLDAIVNDRSHVYNTGHHGYEAAEAEVLGLRRLLLGAENRPAVEYREAAADQVPVARTENVPLSALYTREDFLTGIPGDVPEPERTGPRRRWRRAA